MTSASMNNFNGACSDEPLAGNPRVHQEGREFYERNAKASNWYEHGNHVADAKPEARLRSAAARSNAERNRGCMGESMCGYADPVIERTVHPRAVKGEAKSIAAENQGGSMKNLIVNYGNLEVSPPPGPKVKGSDAEEYKEREKGSKYLINHYSNDPIPASEQPLPPRLGLGGDEVAVKHQGKGMGPLMRQEGTKTPREPKIGKLHQTSKGGGWDEEPPHTRMRPEGEGIAQKNSSDSINDIILQNNVNVPQRKDPKILKHMTESESPRSRAHKGVVGDGLRNREKALNREEMSAIMHGSPSPNGPQQSSGKKILPHLKRSELW